MSNGLIVILDREEAYAVKLAEYFKAKSGIGYEVQAFTDVYSFLDFDKANSTDILIISEVFGDFISDFSRAAQIYILSEGMLKESLSEYPYIYKYQSSENIIREVMTNYAALPDKQPKVLIASAPFKIISVYSPVKRCGKTTFSLVLGSLLSRTEPSLYISLEEYSALSFFTGASETGDLSDLLYFYRQNPLNLHKKLMALSRSLQKLDYIPPMHFSLDFKYMSSADWCEFIKAIGATGRYKNIIIDISDSAVDIFDILSISDIIYFPVLNDAISDEKVKNFKNSVSLMGKDGLLDKLKEISLPMPDIKQSGSDAFFGILHGRYADTVAMLINS